VAGEFRRGATGTTFGAPGHFRPREKNPTDLSLHEAPAVAQLRELLDAEEAHYRKKGRYASFDELSQTGDLKLTVSHTSTWFDSYGYRFTLKVQDGSFTVVATPRASGSRPFTGDDTGFIVANP
jgi:hypothetical protein